MNLQTLNYKKRIYKNESIKNEIIKKLICKIPRKCAGLFGEYRTGKKVRVLLSFSLLIFIEFFMSFERFS